MGYTNQFNLEVGTTLNTTNIPKKLQELNAQLQKSSSTKIEIPVKWHIDENSGKKVIDQVKNIYKEVNTYKDRLGNTFKEIKYLDSNGNLFEGDYRDITGKLRHFENEIIQTTSTLKTLTTETHKFVDSKGNIQTWVTTIDNAGKTVSVRTKEMVDDMGNITTTTSRLEAEAGKPFQKVGQDITKVSEILRETTSETNTVVGQITDTIDGVTKTFNGTITTIKKVSSNGEELTTVISRYKDDLGRTIEKTEQFNKANQQVATTMRKISEATPVKNTKTATFVDKDGNKTITEYINNVATLRTEIKQYTDDVGNLIVKTEKYDAVTNQLISSNEQLTRNIQAEVAEDKKKEQELDNLITKIIEQRKEQERLNNALVSSTTTRTKGTATLWGDSSGKEYQALITTIKSVDAEGRKTIKTIEEFTDAEGRLVQQTRTTDAQLNKIAEDEQVITDASQRAGNGIKGLGESAEKANYGVRNLGWTLSDAFSRLANFYLASLPLRALQSGISNTIETIKDFDSALIEFRKVSDLAGESLTNYVSKLAEMGELTGSTMQAMVEASTEFRKSGFTDADSAKLASIAEIND